MNKTQHDDEARAVINMACAQVRLAKLLGAQAAALKLCRHHNPFARAVGHDLLSMAWLSGLREAECDNLPQELRG